MILFFGKIIEKKTIINQIIPNFGIFIAHLIATIILIFLLTKFVYKPFCKAMRIRRNKIQEILSNATKKQAQANINQKIINKLLIDAKNKANSIIKLAHYEAQEKKNKILKSVKQEIKQLKIQTKYEIKKEKEHYYDNIRKLIINIAFDLTYKILNKEINIQQQQTIINNFISDLKKIDE